MKQSLSYIVWPAIAGLLAALLILDRWVLVESPVAGVRASATTSYAKAVRAATPSVVNIYTAKVVTQARSPLLDDSVFQQFSSSRGERRRIERSLGSGVIMSAEGHILTNNHVITGADAIQVMLHDGRSASAMVIGTDPATDLAVLKIDLPDLPPMALGDSDSANVGDVVLAIGNPLGFGHSVTQGIVSALGRYGLQLNAYEDYIQTDATIHLGNSGGALTDAQGRLLGINTLIYTADNQNQIGTSNGSGTTGIGISLAIPVNLAVFVMQDLINFGEVIRGWMGVSVEPTVIRLGAGSPQQALNVVAVAVGSPASKAGIKRGDVITHIDNNIVKDGRLTMHQIAKLRPGDKIRVSIQRNNQSLELRAIVGVLNQSAGASRR